MVPSSVISAPGKRTRWSEGRRWGTRALFAVLDQGLISGSNFLIGIQLARSLPAAGYGAYALAFSIFSLLSMIHQAIVLEPMSVFGGSKYRSSMQRYLGKLLGYQTAISLACLGALFLGGVGIYAAGQSSELAVALVGVSFATPCVLMLAFARRALYLEYRSTTAASGAVLYSVLLFSGFWFLDRANGISPFSVFLDIGASALAASMLLMLAVRPSLKQSRRDANFPVANEHWCYGRWALGSSICIWIAWNVWYTILGSISGLAETGSLKALINIAMPVIQSCAALSLLVLPHTAEVAHSEGRGGAKRQALIVALLFAGGATLYWAAVLLCRDPLIAFLYSGRYRYTGNDLPWLALASIASAAIVGPASALRALEKPATVCIAFLISSSAGLIIGIPATRFFGVSGAISGILISSLLALGVLVFALARGKRLQARSGAPEVSTQLAQ